MKTSRSRLSADLIEAGANDQLVPKLHIALHRSSAVLPLFILSSFLR